ncbi:hypothetical protein MMC06_001302 [Schaereria dolodes]|nr:hypothetical protein [Schaereria dolodes]
MTGGHILTGTHLGLATVLYAAGSRFDTYLRANRAVGNVVYMIETSPELANMELVNTGNIWSTVVISAVTAAAPTETPRNCGPGGHGDPAGMNCNSFPDPSDPESSDPDGPDSIS